MPRRCERSACEFLLWLLRRCLWQAAKQPGHFGVPALTCKSGRCLVFARCRWISTVHEKELDDLQRVPIVVRREHEGRVTSIVGNVDVGALVEQQPDRLNVA